MTVASTSNLTFSYGGPPVLENANFRIEAGDRVCLFGRNGEGKSTFMQLLAGQLKPDSGSIDIEKNANVSLLPQEVPQRESGTVYEVIARGLGNVSAAMIDYQAALNDVAEDPSARNLEKLDTTQHALERVHGWDLQQRVAKTISKLDLDGTADFSTLSGGWRRRVFLARALALEPKLLILDEPTNHLDIDAIKWLEQFLTRLNCAMLFVTHDRAFLRAVATRIVELDRGQLVEFPPDFDRYVEAKTHALEIEERHDALFDKKLAEEEVWIRTGIQARRTRNEGRVRALKKLRNERKKRRDRKGQAEFNVQAAKKSGDLVIAAENAGFSYDDRPLINNFNLIIRRGSRVGLIGPNGVGKTTLLRLLLGELEPNEGSVELGTQLEIAYFDQLRNTLDAEKTLAETVVEKGDFVDIDGHKRHIVSYLKDFLFSDFQARAKVSVLSGGERNRLLLAKLFSKPANLLVLDEPTNDLDIETLEILENQLLAFPGTVLLVSHDREFLDNVVTDALVFEGDGVITRVVGGYDAWEQLKSIQVAEQVETKASEKKPTTSKEKSSLTYAERLELEKIPSEIERLESELNELHAKLAIPANTADRLILAELTEDIQGIEQGLETLMVRWDELESKA